MHRWFVWIFLVILFLCVNGITNAEWIYPITNPGIQVDSVQRFLVVRDTTKEKLFGKKILSMGDITGDGASDVLICRNEGNLLYDHPSFLFYGGESPSTEFVQEFSKIKWPIDDIGDINNDGYTDFGMYSADVNYYFFFGGVDFDDSVDFIIPNLWSWTPKVGDVDNNGTLDIPLSTNPNGGYVNIYSIDSIRDTIPEYIIPDTSKAFGNRVRLGDFNGDSIDDIVNIFRGYV